MLPRCLLRSLFQSFLVQNKLGNMGPSLAAWLLCNANRNDLAAEQNQHGCVFAFIRFLWGDEADWVLYIRTSDNSVAIWVTGKRQPMLEVMQSCAAAAGLPGNSLPWGFELLFPTARGDARLRLTAGQQGNDNTSPWLSEGKDLSPKGGWLPAGLVPNCGRG